MNTRASTRARTRRRVAGAVAVACLAGVLGACGSSPATPEPGSESDHRSTPFGPAVSYRLSTHCGISEVLYQGRYYEIVPRLHNGSFSAPEGWDSPLQEGTLTPVSETAVVFTDDAGHRVTFTLRRGATTWKEICS